MSVLFVVSMTPLVLSPSLSNCFPTPTGRDHAVSAGCRSGRTWKVSRRPLARTRPVAEYSADWPTMRPKVIPEAERRTTNRDMRSKRRSVNGHDACVPLKISVLAARPDLVEPMWSMPNSWPEFMRHDPIGGLFYGNVETRFADYFMVGQDDTGDVIACAYSIPFLREGAARPDNGWDFVIRNGLLANIRGQKPDAISAVEIAVRPDRQGAGHSTEMLVAMRENAARHGFAELVAPVRPSGKADVSESMSTYALRVREDGLPIDPWLRVHVRAGGRIAKVAPRSMVIPGTLEEWREWTGLPFDRTGPVVVPGALSPVHCDVEHGIASYVEPNVWVIHRTRD